MTYSVDVYENPHNSATIEFSSLVKALICVWKFRDYASISLRVDIKLFDKELWDKKYRRN